LYLSLENSTTGIAIPPGHATNENSENTRQETTGVDFKVNLRKVVKKPANLEEDSSSAKPNSQILDFKSNLRYNLI
jgi:hypothetical protein